MYVETIGYSINMSIPTEVIIKNPNHIWHIWLTGDVYKYFESKDN